MTGTPPPPDRTLVLSDLLVPPSVPARVAGAPHVITPNRAAARALGLGGRSLDLDWLARRVLQQRGVHVASRVASRRALREAVGRVGGVQDVRGFAAAVEGTLGELMRAGPDVVALVDEPEARVRRLAEVAREVRAVLGERDRIAHADALWRAAEVCADDPSLRERVVVVGYPRLPIAERAFLNTYAATGSVVYLPCADAPLFAENRVAVEHLRTAGWGVEIEPAETIHLGDALARKWIGTGDSLAPAAPVPPVAVSARAYPDLDAEVRGTLAEVKRLLLDGVGADAIAVVARHEQDYGPALLAVADEYDVPFRVLYTVPLQGTRFGGWLGGALELLAGEPGTDRDASFESGSGGDARAGGERSHDALPSNGPSSDGPSSNAPLWNAPASHAPASNAPSSNPPTPNVPFETIARWLRHPLTGALGPDAWPAARRTRPRSASAWSDIGVDLPEPWPERATRGRYLGALGDLFRRYDVERGCARWAREAHAFHAFQDGLAAFEDPDEELTRESFRAEVGELLSLLTTPATPGAGGVELHTPLSLFGAAVEHVFVVGVAEGRLPNPVRPDPFLDPFERAELQERLPWLEDVRGQARREEISFWALLQTARGTLTLSFPKLAGRSEALASPYIARLGLAPEPASPPPVASLPEYRRRRLQDDADRRLDPVLPRARRAWAVERSREDATPWDAWDGVTGIPYEVPGNGVGVTRLISMAGCPFRFFARSVLSIQEPEDAPTEVDPAVRGTLYHEALHRAVDAARGSTDVRAGALAALDEAFAEAEKALLEERGVDVAAFPKWSLDREDHLTVLRKAIRGPDFLRDEDSVLGLEETFAGWWEGIPVHGRIDRIDGGPDRLTLIDYKSGGSISGLAKDATGRASLDLQLPIYRAGSDALLRELGASGDDRERTTRYYSITRARTIPSREPTAEEATEIAGAMTAAWQGGSFPVDPDRDHVTCMYCPYDAVCRKGPRLERKRRDP